MVSPLPLYKNLLALTRGKIVTIQFGEVKCSSWSNEPQGGSRRTPDGRMRHELHDEFFQNRIVTKYHLSHCLLPIARGQCAASIGTDGYAFQRWLSLWRNGPGGGSNPGRQKPDDANREAQCRCWEGGRHKYWAASQTLAHASESISYRWEPGRDDCGRMYTGRWQERRGDNTHWYRSLHRFYYPGVFVRSISHNHRTTIPILLASFPGGFWISRRVRPG